MKAQDRARRVCLGIAIVVALSGVSIFVVATIHSLWTTPDGPYFGTSERGFCTMLLALLLAGSIVLCGSLASSDGDLPL